MSSKELTLVEPDILTPEEKTELNADIDRIIEAHKANRKEINRLVFESVAAMTEADEAGAELANKGWFARMLGDITGSNQELQDKINSSHAASQYASQQILQKLAEQNLMSFDLLTAVNNKLNASLHAVGEEFQTIYQGLGKFFKYNQNQMVKMELRMEKVERNVKLLTWQSSIEYLDYEGENYTDMNDTGKIVCLVRDFFDITRGEWSTSDLLLLKAAMSAIELPPKRKVNYGQVLEEIAGTETLREKLLGGLTIPPVTDPRSLIAMSGLQKLDALQGDESYMVDTVAAYIADAKPDVTKEDICHDLARNYLRSKADVDVDTKVDSFDMALDLLYNLQQASENTLPVIPETEEAENAPEETSAEEAAPEEKEEVPPEPEKPVIKEKSPELIQAEQLFQSGEYEEAYSIFQQLAENNDGRAMYYLGEYFEHPYGRERARIPERKVSVGKTWWIKGAEAEDPLAILKMQDSDKTLAFKQVLFLAENGDIAAQFEAGRCYDYAIGTAQDYAKAVEWYTKAAMQGDVRAQNNLGNCYLHGHGVEENNDTAVMWYRKAAEQGCPQAQYNLAECIENLWGIDFDDNEEELNEEELDWYERAANQGYALAQYKLGECYMYGYCGVDEDEEVAESYFEDAACQGYAEAQYEVGECYYYGTGVDEDQDEARKWYNLAAAQGHEKAKSALTGNIWDDDDDD